MAIVQCTQKCYHLPAGRFCNSFQAGLRVLSPISGLLVGRSQAPTYTNYLQPRQTICLRIFLAIVGMWGSEWDTGKSVGCVRMCTGMWLMKWSNCMKLRKRKHRTITVSQLKACGLSLVGLPCQWHTYGETSQCPHKNSFCVHLLVSIGQHRCIFYVV